MKNKATFTPPTESKIASFPALGIEHLTGATITWLSMQQQVISDAGRGFHLLTKPVGPICNLDCKYCFYLEKEKLYPGETQWRMSDAVLAEYVRQYIQSQPVPEIHFAWQGGEPTLLGVEFFRKVVALQKQFSGGKTIFNAIQSNGTLLDDEWCEFLVQNKFLVGLSIGWAGGVARCVSRGQAAEADVRSGDARAEFAQEARGGFQYVDGGESREFAEAAGGVSIFEECRERIFAIHSAGGTRGASGNEGGGL